MQRGDDVHAKTVYNNPGLVVTGASAEHLLAMKVLAARDIDLQDVKPGCSASPRQATRSGSASRRTFGWHVMEKTRRQVEHAIADAREERGEPVPELTFEKNATLRAEGARSRSYEVCPTTARRCT